MAPLALQKICWKKSCVCSKSIIILCLDKGYIVCERYFWMKDWQPCSKVPVIFSNISSIQIYNLFNFNGEKCVVGEKNGCKSEVKCQGTDWYDKRGQKWYKSNIG